MEEERENNQQVSKYNSGVAIIYRLNDLWIDAHRDSRAGSFSKWNGDLDRIWCELAADLKNDKEFNVFKKDIERCDSKLAKVGNFQDQAPEGFAKPDPNLLKDRSKQYKILMEKELFLRRLQNHLGKGTAFADDDEDDFD